MGSGLSVSGNLFIEGLNSGDVIFTSISSTPSRGDWKGIYALPGSLTNIKGTTFSYADTAISYVGSPINLENVRFENNNLAVSADSGSVAQTISAIEFFPVDVATTSPPGLW